MKEPRMPAITDTTRTKIVLSVELAIEKLVERIRGQEFVTLESPKQYLALSDEQGKLKPFYAAIVSSEILQITAFERGYMTSVGTSLEETALWIASDYHRVAERGYVLRGTVSSNALSELDSQVEHYERKSRNKAQRPGLDEMVDRILNVNNGDKSEPREIIADLYVLGSDGTEYFFEMKSPKPNKDQCLRMTRRILLTHALKDRPRPTVKSYFAMTYNPYGNLRTEYKWSMPQNYMPFKDSVLIGEEFWNFIGGPTTYEELLSIFRYVGKVKRKYIVDALAFGF